MIYKIFFPFLTACLFIALFQCSGSSSQDSTDDDEEDEEEENNNDSEAGPPETLPFSIEEARDDGAIRLTFPENDDDTISYQNVCFSPDGNLLVLTGFEEGYNDGPAHIFLLDLDVEELEEPVQLTEGDFDDVNVPYGCFHPDGELVVFASDREEANDFWTVTIDGDEPERLTEHGAEPVWIEPVFSPDGNFLAFEQDDIEIADEEDELEQRATVWKIEIDSATTTQLTNLDGTDDDRLPSWSPDGGSILYQHREGDSELWEAFTVPADGGDTTNISELSEEDIPGHDTDLSWSPDGEFAATSSDPDGIDLPAIFLLPIDGGEMIRVTESDENEDGAPCVAPSGFWVAFESHRTDEEDSPSDIWIIQMP